LFRRGAQRGLTLLESLVALAVLAVLAGSAVPSMADWVNRVRLNTVAQELAVDFDFARGAAVARNHRATACKAGAAAGGSAVCSEAGDWSQGWLVFEDRNGNAQREEDEPVLLQRNALPEGWKASGNTTVADYVSYTPLGLTRLVQGGFQAGTITLCRAAAGPTEARRIIVNSVGRPRVAKVTVDRC
jgi:type IV fimbrial biogenesis protein FimT